MPARLFTADAQPREREPARVPLDMAWESAWWARQYPGTSATAWAAYLSGSGERPIPRGTPITRPPKTTVARTYHGVLVTESADGWQAANVVSVCEVAVDAPALAVVSERKQKQRRAA